MSKPKLDIFERVVCLSLMFQGCLFLTLKIHKAHIPNIHALNSDTHTLRIQYEYTQKQCVGVAIEGMDIWYMGLIHVWKLTSGIIYR